MLRHIASAEYVSSCVCELIRTDFSNVIPNKYDTMGCRWASPFVVSPKLQR
jgi:hypothetical protein